MGQLTSVLELDSQSIIRSPFSRPKSIFQIRRPDSFCNRTFFFFFFCGYCSSWKFFSSSFKKKKIGGAMSDAWRAEFPNHRWNMSPLQWKQGALTTGPPRESLKQNSYGKICMVPLFSWAPKSPQTVTAAMKLRDSCSLKEKL